MTPFGHASVSYLAGKSSRRIWIPAVLLGGILPDVDCLFFFHSAFNQIHRFYTHNLFFVLLSSVLIGLFANNQSKKWTIISLIIGGLLHLIIDACMDSNPSNGMGVPFFWPITDSFFSPVNLLPPTKNTLGWDNPGRMIRLSFFALFWELPLYFASFLLIYKNLKKNTAKPGSKLAKPEHSKD